MKLINIKSLHPENEFAPSWNIPIHLSTWGEHEKVNKIKNFLIDKESEVLDQPVGDGTAYGDGRTGLGLDSVTSKSGTYTLFDFNKELSDFNDLLDFMRISYLNFISECQSSVRDSHIVCWYNIVRTGQSINTHFHGTQHHCYLSGNMHLDDYPTTTNYYIPYDATLVHKFPNTAGGLTMFPTYMPHGVDTYTGEDIRVSIAFDLHTDIPEDLVSIPFIDNEIFNRLTSSS
jgi:hypothetical protein|tara:strand:- start:78 stop:770 length:693 start_codon:yes stop_codon:yes gene_type:complete